jgi:SAM-dependent methyltransferase
MCDAEHPEFWDQRYAAHRTPWDFGGIPVALRDFLATHPGGGDTRVLIPGCGSGYEIEAFVRGGYAVTAIDFSAPAVARARDRFGHLGQSIIQGDFFSYDFAPESFAVIYERTFLCALPPERWPATRARYARLLPPGGLLAGLFYFGGKDDGPPFGLEPDEAARLFGEHFTVIDDQPAADSLPLFAGRERWQVRRRIPAP